MMCKALFTLVSERWLQGAKSGFISLRQVFYLHFFFLSADIELKSQPGEGVEVYFHSVTDSICCHYIILIMPGAYCRFCIIIFRIQVVKPPSYTDPSVNHRCGVQAAHAVGGVLKECELLKTDIHISGP